MDTLTVWRLHPEQAHCPPAHTQAPSLPWQLQTVAATFAVPCARPHEHATVSSVQSLAGDGTIGGSHATSTGLTFHDGRILGKSLCIRRGQRRDGTCEQVHAPAARLPHEQVGCPARGWFSTAARSQLQWPAEVLPQLHLGFSTADYMLIHSPQQRGNYSLAVAFARGFLSTRTFDACGRRRDRRALCGEVNGN